MSPKYVIDPKYSVNKPVKATTTVPQSPSLDSLISSGSAQVASNASRRQAAGGGSDSSTIWKDGSLNITGAVPSPQPTAPQAITPSVQQNGSTSSGGVVALTQSQKMALLSPDEKEVLTRFAEMQKTGTPLSDPRDIQLVNSANAKIAMAMGDKTGGAPSGGGSGGGRGGKGGGRGAGAGINPIKGSIAPGSFKDGETPNPSVPTMGGFKLPEPKGDTGFRTINGKIIPIGTPNKPNGGMPTGWQKNANGGWSKFNNDGSITGSTTGAETFIPPSPGKKGGAGTSKDWMDGIHMKGF